MKYRVLYMPQAQKQLKKMDRNQARIIVAWIRKNLEGTTNPRQYGKGLVGNRSGEWRYRIGNYRILANINESDIVIEIFSIGHRSIIYKK
ncbi:type II toxin-antitoxin system RelE/ParE family toxin [Enterococcus casseliflavus]|uniref:type II toxin-antitoxin system RelE family toxin n=1 Tax=Enterococcus sp. 8E11_MSG4843 TaxID=1834190 RepID=UPI000B3E5A89|nr:type II toxin-antitoxin system RelE/ParE family toxin [Enterococcus sp. 8E11_MSG4843]MBO1098038.1 type II toxin-antitoxin system RelE/ParE family toxin [Enterococcus casseliflavus]MBO1145518.1 type II toxin-antitoxin system RelE/ParE family toxin [Enterococcus casseliflavus]OUZ28259.1 plasmid stabilization protein [Enterococcus sp. 8E11_MSG4843]